ncbi:hypothetical protein ACIBSV_20660 [Embleya sp. NPDC050154]
MNAGGEAVRAWTGREGEAVLRVPSDLAGKPLLVRFAGDGYYEGGEATVD